MKKADSCIGKFIILFIFSIILYVVFFVFITGWREYSGHKNKNSDQDGNAFNSLMIGKQEWMESNLQVSTFRNGEKIIQAHNSKEWRSAELNKTAAWCWPGFSKKNKAFGKYYNYYAIIDSRGLAPKGWKVPSIKDYQKNISTPNWYGGYSTIREHKSRDGWTLSCNGLNSSGFNIFPVGYCSKYGGFKKDIACYWTKSSLINNNYRKSSRSPEAFFIEFKQCDCSDYSTAPKGEGMPIRCIKN